jgi:hypothetical protein
MALESKGVNSVVVSEEGTDAIEEAKDVRGRAICFV